MKNILLTIISFRLCAYLVLSLMDLFTEFTIDFNCPWNFKTVDLSRVRKNNTKQYSASLIY